MNNDEELDLETESTQTITSSGSLKAAPKNPDMAGYEAQAKANKANESLSMAKVLGRFDADVARKAIAEQTGDITTLDAIQRNTDGGARVGADGLYLAPVPQVDKILGDNTPEGRAIYENNFRRNEAKLQLITDEYKKSKIREGRSVAENVLADTAYIAGSGVAGIADILTSGVGLIGMGGGMLIQGIGTLGGKDNMVVDMGVFLQDLSVQELNAYNDWVKRNLNKLTPTGTVEVVGEIAQNVVPVAASVAATVATGGAAAPTVAAAASARGISSAVARRLTNRIANQAAKKIAKTTAATYAAAATQQYLAREAEGKTSQEYQDYLRQKTGGDILSDAAWGVVVGYTNYWLEKAFGAEASIGRYFGRGSTGLMRAAGRSGLEESITEVAQDTSLNVADYLRYLAGNEDRGMTLEDVYNNFVSEDTLKTFVLSAAIGGFTGAGEYATARSNLVKEYKTNLKKVFPTATEEQLETAGKAFIRSTEDNVVSKVKQSLIADDQLINQYGTYHAIVQNRLNELIDQSIAQGKELAFKDKSPEYQAQFVGSTAQRFVDELYSQAVLRGVPVSEVFDTTQMQVDNGILYMYGTEYGRRPLSQFTREMTPEQWYRAQNEARIADELQKKQKAAAEATRKAEREARAAERQRVAEERKLARELAQQEREARAAERAAEKQRIAEAKQTAADEAALPFRDYLESQGVASVDDLTNREAIRDSRVFARAEIRDMEENVARGILAQLRSDLPVLTMKQSEIKQILRGEIDRFIALQDRTAIKPIQAAPSMLDRQRAVVERKRRIAKPLSFSQNMREAGISKDAVERLGLEGEFKKILDKNYRFYVRRNGKISNFEEVAMEYKYQDRYETTRTQPATVNDFLELLEQDLKTKNIYSYQDEAALRNWEENSIRAERERQQQIMGENAEAKAYLETNGVDTTGMTDEQILSEAGKMWNQNNPTLTMDDDIELGEDVPDDLYFQTLREQSDLAAENARLDAENPAYTGDTIRIINPTELKQAQYEVIKRTNPMTDDYHVGIRSADDIKTFAETINDDESFVWGDYSREDARRDLAKNEITIYSSYPIENGVFVSTSRRQAEEYAGGRGNKVYERTVPLDYVAWINGDEGQFAITDVVGKKRTVFNSNGDRIAQSEPALRNFYNWFGDSKVVDEQGRPLVVYHGTSSKFDSFNQDLIGSANDSGFYGRGFYFATRKGEAAYYGGIVMPVYLKADKVFDVAGIDSGALSGLDNVFEKGATLLKKLDLLNEEELARVDFYEKTKADFMKRVKVHPKSEVQDVWWAEMDTPSGEHLIERAWESYNNRQGALNQLWSRYSEYYVKTPNGERFRELLDGLSLTDYMQSDSDNPIRFTEKLKSMGYDGIYQGDEYVVFEPTQIKSVENRGTFDVNDPNIYRQKTIGAWNPLRKTIELGTGANETTIAHELSHFWLDNMMMYSRLAQAAQNEGFMRVWKNIKRYLDIDDRQDVVNVAQAEKYTSAYMQYIRNNKIAPVSDLGFKGLDEYIGDISLDYFENAMHREEDGTYSSELEKLTPEIVEALQSLTTTDLSRYRDTILEIQSGEMPIGDITDARLGKEATPEQMRTSGAAEVRAQQDKQITEALKAAEADAQPITTPETTPSMKTAEEVVKSAKDTSSRYEIGTTDEESFAKAREIIANNRDLAEQAVLEDPSGITDGIANEFIALELAQQAMQQGRNTTPYLASFVNGASAAGANLRVASLLNKPELAWAKDIYEASKAREYAVALRMRPAVKNAIMNRSAIVRAMESRLDEYVEKLYPQLLQAQSYEEQVKIINDWGNNTARELGITPSTDMWYQTIGGNVGAKKTDFTKAIGYQKRKLKDFLKSKLGEGLSDAEQLKVRELHRNAIDALRELRNNPTDQATKINFIKQTRAYQDYLNALQPANWATSLFASIPRASMLFRISTQVKNTLGTRVEILLSDINRTMRYGKGSLIADKDIDAEIKDSMNMFSIGGFSPDVQESFFESPTLAWGEKQFSLIARGGEKRGAVFSKERLAQDAKDIAEYARNNWKSDDPKYKKAWVATKIALGTVERTVGKSFDILAYSDAFMKADIAVKETAKAATFYAKAEGKANNWTQAQIKARAYELFADARSYIPKTKLGESIRKRAVEQAKLETFIKSGTLAQMANNVRNALNLGKESGIGTFISPFVSTPANVMQLGVDYATGWWRRFGSQTITTKDGSTITLGWKECKQRIQENAAAGKPINEYDMEWLEKGYRGSFGGLFLATMLALFKGAQAITDDDDVLDYVPPYQSLNARERQYYRAVNGGKYNAIKVGNVWVNAEYFGGLSEAITAIGTWYHNNSVISSLTTEIMRTPVVGDLLETKQDFDRDIQYNKSLLDSAFEGASSQLSKYIPGIIQDIDRAREKGALYVGFGGSFGITTDSDVKSVKDAQMDSGAAYSPITRGKAFSGIDQATKRKINRDFDELYNADAAKWLRTHPSAKPEAKKKALNDIRKNATAKIKRKYKIK